MDEFGTNGFCALAVVEVPLRSHKVQLVYLGENCKEGVAHYWGGLCEGIFAGEDFFLCAELRGAQRRERGLIKHWLFH